MEPWAVRERSSSPGLLFFVQDDYLSCREDVDYALDRAEHDLFETLDWLGVYAEECARWA